MDTNELSISKGATQNYQNEFHRLRVNLLRTGNLIQHQANAELENFGITQQQFNALRILRGQIGVKRDAAFSTNDLRDLLLDKMSDTSRLVDRLLLKELIHKKPCDMDGRRVHLTITEKGLTLLAEIDKQMHRLDNLVNKITDEEARQINDLLDKIR